MAQQQAVLVLNAGSSSLKYQVVEIPSGSRLLGDHLDRIDTDGFGAALERIVQELTDAGIAGDRLAAIGHRVVRGGAHQTAPAIVDDELLASVDDLAGLAPLHNPPAAEGIRRARAAYPDLPQVAVFDTAFFADLPQVGCHTPTCSRAPTAPSTSEAPGISSDGCGRDWSAACTRAPRARATSRSVRTTSYPSSSASMPTWTSRVVEATLVSEAIGMWLITLFGTIHRWYHANDEIYLSDAYQQQRAQTMLDYYAHVWYPSS